MNSTLEQIGGNLRRRRKNNGWTQEDAAKRFGMGLGTYRKMESGAEGVAIEYWVKTWEFYGCAEPVIAATTPPGNLFDKYDALIRARKIKNRSMA